MLEFINLKWYAPSDTFTCNPFEERKVLSAFCANEIVVSTNNRSIFFHLKLVNSQNN